MLEKVLSYYTPDLKKRTIGMMCFSMHWKHSHRPRQLRWPGLVRQVYKGPVLKQIRD
jgi:hypothetical protein